MANESPTPKEVDLVRYTIVLSGPAAWSDANLRSAALSLNEAMESALSALTQWLDHFSDDFTISIDSVIYSKE